MTMLIHDGTIITAIAGAVQVLPHHSLVIDSGRVAALAPAATTPTAGHTTVVDARRHLVIPGLVNTHLHLFQSLTRCLPAAQDVRLFDWLLRLYEHWRGLDYAALKMAAEVSLAELALHGATTTSDHQYMFPPHTDARIEAVLEAADTVGLRIHVCRGSMTLGQRDGGLPPDDCVERDADVLADCARVLDRWHDPAPHSLRRIDLAPCSPFNVTRELLRDTRVLARERGVLLHTHLAETREEEAFCLDRFGCRPVQYLADLDWLGPDVYLAHCVCLNDEEVALLGRTRTGVTHCPSSNMRLSSGIAPLEALLAAGARIGIGVDGSRSNAGGALLGEARQALLAARLRAALMREATAPADSAAALFPARTAFTLATRGGADVLNRPELGHLAPGAAADLALYRADDIAFAGALAQDPVAALMLCAAPRADRAYVAGREIVRDGRLVTLDTERLSAEFNTLVARRFRR